ASRGSPILMQIGDDQRVDAAAHDIPNMRALNFGADTHAASAQDAAVVVEGEPFVRGVNAELGVAIRKANMGQALLLAEGLQFAVAVGDANRADMVALGEEQFQNRAAML